jgi:hypothetical protein
MLLFLSLRSKPLTLLHLGNISSALMLRARRASRPRPAFMCNRKYIKRGLRLRKAL